MLNKVTLIGRLGAQPEMAATPSGSVVTKFSLATSETFNKDGQKREETEWHRIVLFGRVAEIANQYLQKGDLVYLEGKIKTSKWQDPTTGQDRYSTEVICNEMKMMGSPSSTHSSQAPAPQQNAPKQQHQQPRRASQQQQGAPAQQPPQQHYAQQQPPQRAPQQQYQQNAPQQNAYANRDDDLF